MAAKSTTKGLLKVLDSSASGFRSRFGALVARRDNAGDRKLLYEVRP